MEERRYDVEGIRAGKRGRRCFHVVSALGCTVGVSLWALPDLWVTNVLAVLHLSKGVSKTLLSLRAARRWGYTAQVAALGLYRTGRGKRNPTLVGFPFGGQGHRTDWGAMHSATTTFEIPVWGLSLSQIWCSWLRLKDISLPAPGGDRASNKPERPYF